MLAASQEVWEAALDQEVTRGLEAGERHGRDMGVTFVPFDTDDQTRFDALYQEMAKASADDLVKSGIDGPAIFGRAQALVARATAGQRPLCTPAQR